MPLPMCCIPRPRTGQPGSDQAGPDQGSGDPAGPHRLDVAVRVRADPYVFPGLDNVRVDVSAEVYERGKTIESVLGDLGATSEFGQLATEGEAERAVLRILAG
jgi:hypothetical protein